MTCGDGDAEQHLWQGPCAALGTGEDWLDIGPSHS
jgi:hypothetical protein